LAFSELKAERLCAAADYKDNDAFDALFSERLSNITKTASERGLLIRGQAAKLGDVAHCYMLGVHGDPNGSQHGEDAG